MKALNLLNIILHFIKYNIDGLINYGEQSKCAYYVPIKASLLDEEFSFCDRQ